MTNAEMCKRYRAKKKEVEASKGSVHFWYECQLVNLYIYSLDFQSLHKVIQKGPHDQCRKNKKCDFIGQEKRQLKLPRGQYIPDINITLQNFHIHSLDLNHHQNSDFQSLHNKAIQKVPLWQMQKGRNSIGKKEGGWRSCSWKVAVPSSYKNHTLKLSYSLIIFSILPKAIQMPKGCNFIGRGRRQLKIFLNN